MYGSLVEVDVCMVIVVSVSVDVELEFGSCLCLFGVPYAEVKEGACEVGQPVASLGPAGQ